MTKNDNTLFTEKVLEDILASDRSILAEILNVNTADLSLVARQKQLPSGILDLLFLCHNGLILIELKAVPFYKEVIFQIEQYNADLLALQKQNRLISTSIKKVILVTKASERDRAICANENIHLVIYSPEQILNRFYMGFRERAVFMSIQPSDFGVVRLGLLYRTISLIANGKSISEICATEDKSLNTIRNRIYIASQLNLVSRYKSNYFITDFCNSVLSVGTEDLFDDFSDIQKQILSDFVIQNPFNSAVTYAILAMVETVFNLSKSLYPVPEHSLRENFVTAVAKGQTWKTDKARKTATYTYANYACELLFLAKCGNEYFITPRGVQAMLLLQLNRSIKLLESQAQ